MIYQTMLQAQAQKSYPWQAIMEAQALQSQQYDQY